MQISNLLKVLNKITKNSNVCKDKLCAVAARLAAVDYRKLWWWGGGGRKFATFRMSKMTQTFFCVIRGKLLAISSQIVRQQQDGPKEM